MGWDGMGWMNCGVENNEDAVEYYKQTMFALTEESVDCYRFYEWVCPTNQTFTGVNVVLYSRLCYVAVRDVVCCCCCCWWWCCCC